MTGRNIVFVAPFALEPRGTVRARMIPLARELQARGNDVTIFVPPWDNTEYSGRRLEIDGIEILNVRFEGGALEHLRVVGRLVRAVHERNPDLVHVFKPVAHSGLVAAILSTLPAGGIDCPVVLDSDDWEGDGGQNDRSRRSSPEELCMHYQERFVPRLVDAVTVASRTLETQMWGLGIDPDRVFYAPNGQDDARFDPSGSSSSSIRLNYGIEDGPVVLLYTRFFEYDLERAVEIFRRTRQQIPDANFVVVGDGRDDERETFARLVERTGIEKSTYLVGWIEPDELPKFFELADVAVYPFDDTLINRAKCPAKLTELMVAGQCIVADEVGQVGEYLVDGQSGLLTKPGDTNAFVNALVRALESPKLRKRLGSNAHDRILSEFSWDVIAATVEVAYNRVE